MHCEEDRAAPVNSEMAEAARVSCSHSHNQSNDWAIRKDEILLFSIFLQICSWNSGNDTNVKKKGLLFPLFRFYRFVFRILCKEM